MANTAQLIIQKRLDDLEVRVKALEGGYVKVPPLPIESSASPICSIPPETDETKPDLPDKETKDEDKTDITPSQENGN